MKKRAIFIFKVKFAIFLSKIYAFLITFLHFCGKFAKQFEKNGYLFVKKPQNVAKVIYVLYRFRFFLSRMNLRKHVKLCNK